MLLPEVENAIKRSLLLPIASNCLEKILSKESSFDQAVINEVSLFKQIDLNGGILFLYIPPIISAERWLAWDALPPFPHQKMVLDDLRDSLSIDVSNYFKDYIVSLSTIDAALKTIEYATILLESTNEEYNLGTKSITDLINAETELLDANVQYFSANQNYLINYFNLLALDGSLIELFKEYLPKYN